VLSTLNLAPLPVSNGMTNLAEALRYAADHGFADVELEPGTEPFTPKPAALLPRSLAERG
jgi:sugar phosphate isomerase/epimerase